MVRSSFSCALVLLSFLAFFSVPNVSAQSGTCLDLYPDTLEFSWDDCFDLTVGYPLLDTAILSVVSCDSVDVSWSVWTSDPWIIAQPDSGINSDTVFVWIDPTALPPLDSALAPGDTTYVTGYVAVDPGAQLETPYLVPVRLARYCSSSEQRFQADPNAFHVTTVADTLLDLQFQISEVHGDTVYFDILTTVDWLFPPVFITPPSTPTIVSVTLNTAGMTPGTYTSDILITTVEGTQPPNLAIPVTVTILGDDLRLAADPPAFDLEYIPLDSPGVVYDTLRIFEETGAAVGFWSYNKTNWLYLDTIPLTPLETPEVIPVHLNLDLLGPGTHYDTIFVWSSEVINSPLIIPVSVTIDAGGYVVNTWPETFSKSLLPGTGSSDSLVVYEAAGRSIPFRFSNSEPWLVVEPFGISPYYTPSTLTILYSADSLLPGIYTDTILIEPVTDSQDFQPVMIPVHLHVIDSVSVAVEPDYFEFRLTPGDTLQWGQVRVTELNDIEIPVKVEKMLNSPWLDINTDWTYYTPAYIGFWAGAGGMEPGAYSDTLRIYDPTVPPRWEAVKVPVVLFVDTADFYLEVYPASFDFTLPSDTGTQSLFVVYESTGANVEFHVFNTQPWLIIPEPFTPWVTPDSIPFMVEPYNLSPGVYYDTIGVNSSVATNVPRIPVRLTVTDGDSYIVDTDPSYLRFYWDPAHGIVWEDLLVYETSGDTIPFNITRNIPWLTFDTGSAPPAWTPWSVYVAATPSNDMPPGTYVDTMFVFAVDSAYPFNPVAVPVWLNIPDTGQQVVALPDHFQFTVMEGSNLYRHGLLVYEVEGDSTHFAVQKAHGSPWLAIYDDSVRITPDSVFFNIMAADLAPGYYADTIVIYDPTDDLPSFDDVYVLVELTVVPDSTEYTVLADPPSINLSLDGSADVYDSIFIYEQNGVSLDYAYYNVISSWLQLEPYNMLPVIPQTPSFLHYLIDADSLPAGFWYDTIYVTPVTDSLLWEALKIPVHVTIGPLGGSDSLIIPLINPGMCGGTQPVLVQAGQPLRGVTVPIKIPGGIEPRGISFEGTVVENWDYQVEVINPDSGYILVVLFNTYGDLIPAGRTKIFDIVYGLTGANCQGMEFVYWDTTLSWDPSRSLLFSDVDHNEVHPGFTKSSAPMMLPGYIPGDMDGDSTCDITDLTRLVSYLFLYGEPPCVMNATDVNGSCTGPNISDLTYMVSAMFLGGTELQCGCLDSEAAPTPGASSKVEISSSYENGVTTLTLESDVVLSGLQLELQGDLRGEVPKRCDVSDELEMFSGYRHGVLKIGVFDWEAVTTIAPGESKLLSLPGEFRITEAIVSDAQHNDMQASIGGTSGALPQTFLLKQNYPNPFNPTTVIEFELPRTTEITLTVYNVLGQEIRTLASGEYQAGPHRVMWDGTDDLGVGVASGVYMYRLAADDFSQSRKMLFIK